MGSMLQSKKKPITTAWQTLSPDFVAAMAIGGVTLVTYASVVSSFYLWADEAWAFGTFLPRADLGQQLWSATVTWGRPIGMFIQWLQAVIVDIDLDLLILNRVASLIAVAFIAYLIYREMPRNELIQEGVGWLPLGVSLYLVLIPAAQVHAAFSLLLGSSLGLILSFCSYRWLAKPWGWIATACALLLCLMIYQPSAFFIFVAFAVDLWRRYAEGTASLRDVVIRRGLLVVALVVGTSILFSLSFKAIATGTEAQLYDRARPLLALMNGEFGPFLAMLDYARNGLSVFEIWSYPPYIRYIWYMRDSMYLVFLAMIVGVNFFAIITGQTQEERRRRLWVSLGLGAAFLGTLPLIVADGFSQRQNLYYPSQCIIVLSTAFALSRLIPRHHTQTALAFAALLLIAQAFMASSSILTTVIRPQLLAIDFVATKLRESGVAQGSKIALAVTLSRTGADCLYEPCLAFYGRRLNSDFELTQAGFYERVAERFGYQVVAFGHIQKPNDPRQLSLGEPLVVIDIDELRALYAADRVQM
jgi:hypothetical protein